MLFNNSLKSNATQAFHAHRPKKSTISYKENLIFPFWLPELQNQIPNCIDLGGRKKPENVEETHMSMEEWTKFCTESKLSSGWNPQLCV